MSPILTLWFTNGDTAQFQKVTEVSDNGRRLKFNYFGISDKSAKQATFFIDRLSGYAISEVTKEQDHGLKE